MFGKSKSAEVLPALIDWKPAIRDTPLAERISFQDGLPDGPVARFVVVLTSRQEAPLAVGEVHPSGWQFSFGVLGTTFEGRLKAISSGNATLSWLFALDRSNRGVLLGGGPAGMHNEIMCEPGMTVTLYQDFNVEGQPFPSWV